MAKRYSTGEYDPGDEPSYPEYKPDYSFTSWYEKYKEEETGWGYNPQTTVDAAKLAEERRQAGVAYGREEPYSTGDFSWYYQSLNPNDQNSRGGWEYEPYNPIYTPDQTYQNEMDLWYGMRTEPGKFMGDLSWITNDDRLVGAAAKETAQGQKYALPTRYSGAYYQRPDNYIGLGLQTTTAKKTTTSGDYSAGYGRSYGGGGGGGGGIQQAVDWYYGMLNWRI